MAVRLPARPAPDQSCAEAEDCALGAGVGLLIRQRQSADIIIALDHTAHGNGEVVGRLIDKVEHALQDDLRGDLRTHARWKDAVQPDRGTIEHRQPSDVWEANN
eukprot:5522467-Prymnesium_polylepis.1